MSTTKADDALSGYLDQIKSAAYHEGRIAGRREAKAEFRLFSDKFDADFPDDPVAETAPTRRRRRNGAAADGSVPAETVWLPPDEVMPLVKTALADLATTHPEGASPLTIAEHLRHAGGQAINDQAVRTALRQLTLHGAVRRVAHARYLPGQVPLPQGDLPVEAQPQPQAAE